MDYSEENIRMLHAQGLSFTEMGRRMGVTRNKVCGKVSRMGLAKRKAPQQRTDVLAKKLARSNGTTPPVSTVTGPKRPPKPHAGNPFSLGVRPHKHVEMTKAEMYEDLRRAVENTR